ncbi:hypothetical protein NB636_08065 [Oxalobacter aliiformigenes]|uniref:VapE domain-containing protein n=1 Tax=Oxalobacter aliiformigenes TaxID=2946593 RepID=UPI0022B00428|nr:VapE domain-containing protein [Oxalobacter aliiformigenes]MCZ4065706.1 hypothetical protein [Oxalobacter aliiformigenes]WAV98662.1 hypothetical protein NB636_08065 [Oxalobacter aliiformigenes]
MANNFDYVNDRALSQIASLLAEWLPNGVKNGNEYVVGSKYGEAGKSMSIRISGDKAGYWSDFAAGDSGSDLISLYAYINNLDQGAALKEVAGILAIDLQKLSPVQTGKGNKGSKKDNKPRWVAVMPVPDDAAEPPKAHEFRGRPEQIWDYRDKTGRLLGYVYRFATSDGGKEVLPLTYCRHESSGKRVWRWAAFTEPRPLYLPGGLSDDKFVVIVEGEKCARKLHEAVGDTFDVISWPGGSKAVKKADWSILTGRNVILWPDCDAKKDKSGKLLPENRQPGMAAMLAIADILHENGCKTRIVDIPPPGEKPDGWDCADMIDNGASRDDIRKFFRKLRPEKELDTPSGAGAGDVETGKLLRMLIKSSNGTYKACRENVYLILEHDPELVGVVGLDEFTRLRIKRKKLPWESRPGEWGESDDFNLGMYVAKKYDITIGQIGEIEKAVAQAADRHTFNSVTEYLDGCAEKWDGFSRVEMAFSMYWGADDTDYVRLISRMFFVGLVKRAYFPGCKHDCAPVFEGGQGKGKSTALRIVGGDWFSDTAFKMGDKDGFLSIQGVLLYEIAELEQFNRSEVTEIKGFMSSTVDRYREPYGRRIKNMPRYTVFAGTTNEGEYFKDVTGNRRFWPVMTGNIDLDGLERDRDQLLGEAVHLMRQGVLWYPTKDEQINLIEPEQGEREIIDPWVNKIYNYVEGVDLEGNPTAAGPRDKVTALELLSKAIQIDVARIGPAKQEVMRIAACMRKLGWSKGRASTGARERYYSRPKNRPETVTKKEVHHDKAMPF